MRVRYGIGAVLIVAGVVVFALGRASREPHGFVQLSGIGTAYVGLALLADALRKSPGRRTRKVAWVLTAVVLAPLLLSFGAGAWALVKFVLEMPR